MDLKLNFLAHGLNIESMSHYLAHGLIVEWAINGDPPVLDVHCCNGYQRIEALLT